MSAIYLINGVESTWEDIVALAKKKHLQNIDKSTIAGLITTLNMKGCNIHRVREDAPELL